MKSAFILAASLAAGVAFADHTVTVEAPAADTPLKVEHALPADAPMSVVLVAQCGHAVGIYATMTDGTLLAFDMSSGIPFKDQADWANKAKRVVTVDVRCAMPSGVIPPADIKDL